jgi:hypothetical protein
MVRKIKTEECKGRKRNAKEDICMQRKIEESRERERAMNRKREKYIERLRQK